MTIHSSGAFAKTEYYFKSGATLLYCNGLWTPRRDTPLIDVIRSSIGRSSSTFILPEVLPGNAGMNVLIDFSPATLPATGSVNRLALLRGATNTNDVSTTQEAYRYHSIPIVSVNTGQNTINVGSQVLLLNEQLYDPVTDTIFKVTSTTNSTGYVLDLPVPPLLTALRPLAFGELIGTFRIDTLAATGQNLEFKFNVREQFSG